MRRYGALMCAAALLCGLCGCAPASAGATVYDAAGGVMGTPNQLVAAADTLTDAAYSSYMDVALAEAVVTLAKVKEIPVSEAQEALFRDGYSIHTAFDPAAFAALQAGYAAKATKDLTYAAAITDYNGRLLATYSVGDQNYAITPQSPHSAFKPLGVYAPALEAGLIDWSTFFIDKPYKEITNEAGQKANWPKNASGGYTYKKTSLYECIRQSLNTAAVHCLARLGVNASLSFLQSSFAIDLTYEQEKATQQGGEEVIGNIALGSLQKGVTAVEMAGYYQIFGNAGRYTASHAVLEIRDAAGQTVYTAPEEAKQVIQPATAYIMNRLLQGVALGGGTGEEANRGKLPVAGKTGTGNQGEGNWFVGVTPQYSCAVFHGDCPNGNIADALFGAILEQLPAHTTTEFPACSTVHKTVYCSESGKLFSTGCTRMYVGYYVEGNQPERCTAH